MSGTYVTHTSDLDGRITRLDEGARRIISFHSGPRLEDRIRLLETLEDHYSRTPNVPVIHIHRKPPSRGRKGAIDIVECGFCDQSGKKFQNIADHIVSEHFRLNLWHCDVDLCAVSVSRKSDLRRHLRVQHKIVRPREARRSQVSSPGDIPSPPATPLLSPGPGPKRTGQSGRGIRELSPSRSYPVISTSADASPREDTSNWHNDNTLLMNAQPHPSPGHRGDRVGLVASHSLAFGPRGPPTLVLPETAPPTNRVHSFPNDLPRSPYATYLGSSPPYLGTWGTSSDATSLSQRGAVYPLLPPVPCRGVELSRALDHHHSSTFLSPVACTPAASTSGTRLLSASPYNMTTPIQSESVHLGMYASNPTQGHLPSSALNSHYPSINQSSHYLMTSNPTIPSQQYYPPSAQINMDDAVPEASFPAGHWRPTFSAPPSRPYTPYSVDD